MVSKILVTVSLGLLVTACAETDLGKNVDENIGEKLKPVTTIVDTNGVNSSEVIVFDQTTRLLHKFSLDQMTHRTAWRVLNPSLEHYILQASSGAYAVDISQKNISIFRSDGAAIHNPIRLPGNPLSASFRSATGYLVVYDDTGAVGFLKLSPNGDVLDSWVGGSVLTDDVLLKAGDFLNDGRLVLSLSDNSIAIVNADQTMAQKKWIFTRFTSPIPEIKVIAPVPGQPNLVMAFSNTKLALISLATQAAVASHDLAGYRTTVMFSKRVNPHFIFEKNTGGRTLVYVKDAQLNPRDLPASFTESVTTSVLDLATDQWTFVERAWGKNGIVGVKKYQFSGLLSKQYFTVPNQAQLEISNNKLLALHPSELGYAVCYDIDTEGIQEAKLFNLPYIGQ